MTKPSQALATFKEKEILHLLNGTNLVVNLRASFQDNQNIYIVMELVEGLNLAEFMELRS